MADITANFQQVFDQIDQLERRILRAEKAYAGVTQAAQKSGAAQKQALTGGIDAANNEAEALNKLQAEYNQTAQSVQTLRRALNGAYDPRAISTYTKAVADAEAGMRRLERAGEAVGVNLRKASKEVGAGQQAFEGLFGSLSKVAIITAVVAEVGKLVSKGIDLAREYTKAQKQFQAFLGSAEKADATLAALNRFATENFLPTAEVQAAGKALLAFGESANDLPDVLGRIANISAATGKNFNELTTIYGKARAAGVLYAEDINQLTDAGIPIITQFAQQMGVSAGEVKKLASEGKIGFAQLQLAFFELTKQGEVFAGQTAAQADATAKLGASFDRLATTIGNAVKPAYDSIVNSLEQIISSANDLASSNSIKTFVQNSIEFFGQLNPFFDAFRSKLESLIGVNTRKNKDIVDEDEKAYNERRNQAFQERKLLEAAEEEQKRLAAASAKNRKDEAEKARKAREAELKEREAYNKRLGELAIERLDPGSEARAIALENQRFQTLKDEFKKFGLDTEDIEAQHVRNLFNIRAEFYQKNLDAQRKAEAEELKDLNDFLADRQDAFEQQKAVNDGSIAIFEEQAKRFILQLKASGASEDEVRFQQTQLDLQAKKARLQNELEFQQSLLLITDATNTEQVESIKRAIALIKEQVTTIDFQLSNPDTPDKSFSIWRALGIDPDSDEGKRAIDSLKDSAQQFKDVLQQLTDARVQAANAAVEQADRQVQAAESALAREIELSQAGFASNVEIKQQQLEAAKKQQAQALEEQRRAQRAQLAVDAAQQASNIALSITNLYKTWSTLPFGIGLIAAAAQAAGLIALIASVRARARAISQPQQFRQGGEMAVKNGVLIGPSHEAGGVPIEAEGGEFITTDGKRLSIVNKRMTERHFDILQAINRDDRKAIARHALKLSPEIEIDRAEMSRRLFGGLSPVSPESGTSDLSRQMSVLIEIQQRQLALMIRGESKPIVSPDGRKVTQGNRITTYLNK